jgi:hypothetical protein
MHNRQKSYYRRRQKPVVKKEPLTTPPESGFKMSWIPRIIFMIILAGIFGGN